MKVNEINGQNKVAASLKEKEFIDKYVLEHIVDDVIEDNKNDRAKYKKYDIGFADLKCSMDEDEFVLLDDNGTIRTIYCSEFKYKWEFLDFLAAELNQIVKDWVKDWLYGSCISECATTNVIANDLHSIGIDEDIIDMDDLIEYVNDIKAVVWDHGFHWSLGADTDGTIWATVGKDVIEEVG